jgi:hypothetical protein
LECIVRNNPIIVNKNKAIVELLGEKYPLYYEDDKYMNKQIYFTFQHGPLRRRPTQYNREAPIGVRG